MDDRKKFNAERQKRIARQSKDGGLKEAAREFFEQSVGLHYAYNFEWLGLPIIQYPQDVVAMQEIIWKTKPDLIIETGTARGGSAIFYASMLKILGRGKVVSVDIDIRKHNREAIRKHPLSGFVILIEGSSIDERIINKVRKISVHAKKVLVILDSLHTHEHVLAELKAYSKFVSRGSYLVVFDTVIEDLPPAYSKNRPWIKGNNPKTAVREFLKSNRDFILDKSVENKLVITVAPGGYLKRVK
ncbi:MAG: cephalosporin hydroxylase family protein [Patescibacteria group bacterium]